MISVKVTLGDGRSGRKMTPCHAPTWIKWRCDHGRQWTTVEGSWVNLRSEVDGCECEFSGCVPGHVAHVVGRTADLAEAGEWFRSGDALDRYYIEYRPLLHGARSSYRGPFRSTLAEAIRLYHDCDVSEATKHLYRMDDDGTVTEVTP